MSQHPLAQHLDAVPDFPKPGILFSDISPLLKTHFQETVSEDSKDNKIKERVIIIDGKMNLKISVL